MKFKFQIFLIIIAFVFRIQNKFNSKYSTNELKQN